MNLPNGVTLGHWADAERITVDALAGITGETVEHVRQVLTLFGIVPDEIETVGIGELRDAKLLERSGPSGEALRERETRAR